MSPCYPTLQFPSLSAREKHSVTMLPYSTIPVSVCKGETQCHHATLLYNPCLCLQGRNTVSPCYPTPQTLSLCLQTGILRLERHLSTVVATNLLLAPPLPPHPPTPQKLLRMEMSWNAEYSSLNSMGHYFP